MRLPIMPPVKPMLAKPVKDIPDGAMSPPDGAPPCRAGLRGRPGCGSTHHRRSSASRAGGQPRRRERHTPLAGIAGDLAAGDLSGLQGRGHHHQASAVVLEPRRRRRESGGLARPGGTLDHHQPLARRTTVFPGPCEGGSPPGLRRVERTSAARRSWQRSTVVRTVLHAVLHGGAVGVAARCVGAAHPCTACACGHAAG